MKHWNYSWQYSNGSKLYARDIQTFHYWKKSVQTKFYENMFAQLILEHILQCTLQCAAQREAIYTVWSERFLKYAFLQAGQDSGVRIAYFVSPMSHRHIVGFFGITSKYFCLF